MFKRLFFAMVGLGAGVALGVWAVRKVEQAQQRLTPEQLGQSAAARAESLRGRVVGAMAEGRRAAAAKEAELRAVYRVRGQPPSPHGEQPQTPPWGQPQTPPTPPPG